MEHRATPYNCDNNETAMMVQKAYTSMGHDFQLQHINSYHQLSAQTIDQLVEQEMKRVKANYLLEEEVYAEQMLQQNPVIVERRPAAAQKNSSSSEDGASTPARDHTAQQRAESCRKSRINNKIKKAKTKFRHKYVSNKLAQSASVLGNIRDIIAQAESQLLYSGYNQAALQRMRATFGLDRSGRNLDRTVQHMDA